MKKLVPLLILSLTVSAQTDPFKKVGPIAQKLEILPLNSVKPQGWIKQQIEQNLNGFTGHLDELVPELIIADDIYGKDRLSQKVKAKDVGAIAGEGDWQVQFLWWNSETQSNWRDGYIRSAVLANDKPHLSKIKTYVDKILAGQDKDGYLGIYDKELRYKFDNENGELWGKATLLRGLLAWYDYSNDKKVLDAVKRAADNVMQGFPINASHPFYSKNENVGGLSHGLTFTDVLEELYRLTKNKKYLDYALFLYKDFSQNKLNEDAQYSKLIDKDRMLTGHGVHTYEHLRCLAAAYYASGNPELKTAILGFEAKIANETTATGAPVGDEWIGGKKADATLRGYEYCSLQELMHSYESLFAKTADASYGDKIEKLFFNAAQGARCHEQNAIAYLKSDNSFEMTGGLNGDKSDAKQTRYRYSPVHKEAAVCCVPNAGRIAPYFVQYMWMKSENALVASLLGPCEVETTISGKPVKIKELTDYPYDNSFNFEIDSKTDFDLKIRKPNWAQGFVSEIPHEEKDGFVIFHIEKGKREFVMAFASKPETREDVNAEQYFTYGPLVLAHAIDATYESVKKYPNGLDDLLARPKNLVVYTFSPSYVIKRDGVVFETKLINPNTGKQELVELVPVAQTDLRQVTFKKGTK